MRVLKTAIAAVAFLIISSCATTKPTSRQCNRFRNGIFTSHVEGANQFITVYRNDTLQVEVFDGETDSLKLKVTWLDPCTYEMVFLNTEHKGRKILSKIIETKSNFYIYEARLDDLEPISDTMFLVR